MADHVTGTQSGTPPWQPAGGKLPTPVLPSTKTDTDSQDLRAMLENVQHALDLDPNDSQAQAKLQKLLLEKLKKDPYVVFLAETDTNYVITFRHSRPIQIPKAHARSEVFPSAQRTESERILGMVWWVLLGLIPGGVVALVLSVWVLRRAFGVLRRGDVDARERRLAWLAVILASGIGLVGELFTILLVLHLIG